MSTALFQPLRVRSLVLKNRIVISPMMQHAAPGGFANNWHLVHRGKFALGGAGLIFTESTAVSPVGRSGNDDAGLWQDENIAPCRQVRQETAVSVRGIYSGMAPHFLEINCVNDVSSAVLHVSKPPFELQESHPSSLEPLRLEGR